ncbi:hypothetical protein [Gallibacter intestinalis]|uniref:Transposase n=1 Tax=Gallibacter intestinalis TaxID=2779356 RepID=A0ABR9QXY5_9FIRM|nr:hypothetical protein [Gallibacter intestinalis]MBE5035711.1 hypothetical protein [Gallibacter intestinalis]
MYIIDYDKNKPLPEQVRLLMENVQKMAYEYEERILKLETEIAELKKKA